MGNSAPALYTVEEAAKLLRIGRTKAYAMTQEWRATGGRSGLPVVDFGNVLRVPRAALELLVGGDLTRVQEPPRDELAQIPRPLPPAPARDASVVTSTGEQVASKRSTRRVTHNRATDQLDLFDAAS